MCLNIQELEFTACKDLNKEGKQARSFHLVINFRPVEGYINGVSGAIAVRLQSILLPWLIAHHKVHSGPGLKQQNRSWAKSCLKTTLPGSRCLAGSEQCSWWMWKYPGEVSDSSAHQVYTSPQNLAELWPEVQQQRLPKKNDNTRYDLKKLPWKIDIKWNQPCNTCDFQLRAQCFLWHTNWRWKFNRHYQEECSFHRNYWQCLWALSKVCHEGARHMMHACISGPYLTHQRYHTKMTGRRIIQLAIWPRLLERDWPQCNILQRLWRCKVQRKIGESPAIVVPSQSGWCECPQWEHSHSLHPSADPQQAAWAKWLRSW